VLLFQNRVINPAVRFLLSLGLAPPTYALLETTGRRSRLPRQVPVANGLQGSTFWLIAGLGEHAQYVRNINANPNVRVKARPARLRDGLRMRWHSGTARLMPEDDARLRHRHLGAGRPGYRLDGILLRALADLGSGQMLTVRIDLDPEPQRRQATSSGSTTRSHRYGSRRT
jgi:deazaflavin-dependent oxidoreductase (nitroreductase family)